MKKLSVGIATLIVTCSMVVTASVSASDPYTAIIADQENGRYKQALSQISTLLDNNANDAQALLLKGNVSKLMGNTTEAASIFKQLINQYPAMPEAYNNLAVLYADKGQTALAIETLQQVFSTSDSYATAYKNLRELYNQMASSAYREALDIDKETKQKTGQYALLSKTLYNVAVTQAPDAAGIADADVSVVAVDSGTSNVTGVATPNSAQSTAQSTAKPTVVTQVKVVDINAQVTDMVQAWSQAWSQRSVAGYFSFYHQNFIPPSKMSRKQWETYRDKRIQRPKFIEIDVIGITVKQLSPQSATAIFELNYRSDTFKDNVVKKLSLRKYQGDWLIIRELAL
jgi:tetratricopeptide (TPR) repeat protein